MDSEILHVPRREVLNIVFVGHVDAGKSTICGQILVQMNLVDVRTLEKYKQMSREQNRESWYLSWCLDVNPEEREKGKTMEVGTATFELHNKRINILDTPGHKQFVLEMINGANRADIGILVVSARINEFETGFDKGGQTKEHIVLLRSGNVQKLIVLVNKMDDPSVMWCKERFDEIKEKIKYFVKRLFPTPIFIPVSGFTGDYIKDRGTCSWYDGDSFLAELDKIVVDRYACSSLAVTVIEKMVMAGTSALYGKIESGTLTSNVPVKILPQNIRTKVSCLLDEEDVEIEAGFPGDTVKMKLKDDVEDVSVGSRILDPENMDYKTTLEFTCGLNVLAVDTVISSGYKCILHIGVISIPCKIKEVRNTDNKRIRYCRENTKVLAKISLDFPVCVLCSNDSDRKERFSLRTEDKTIAVGVIRNINE